MSITVSPLRDKSGKVIGASKVGRDITERKQAEKLQRLLTEELIIALRTRWRQYRRSQASRCSAPRIRPILSPASPGAFRHWQKPTLCSPKRKMQGADVMEIVSEQVLLGDSDDNSISYSGPLLMLDAQEALHLALVLHELATNARKYGALSHAERAPIGHLAAADKRRTQLVLVMEGERWSKGQRSE